MIHKELADIYNLTRDSLSEKAGLTSYREGKISDFGKVSTFVIVIPIQYPYGGYTDISFGYDQVESPKSSKDENKKKQRCV